MAHVPRSFEEAFRRIRVELVDHVFVSWRLLNQLLQEGLLTQRHVDELKVLCILHNSVADVLLNGFDFGNHSQHGSAELLQGRQAKSMGDPDIRTPVARKSLDRF